jgi:myo-inositol-1(or 4)-monophosphatase
MPQPLSELLALACDAAVRAGDHIRAAFDAPSSVENKGAVDLVTETDLAAEAIVREVLEAGSPYPVLGEEGGGATLDDGPVWVVDPIDGTTNFVHRLPHFAVSIGLAGTGAAAVGVILDVMRQELFRTDGEGAWCNDRPLRPLGVVPLDRALLGTGFPYDRRTNDDDNTREWRAFMKRCQGVRRCGAAALDLAWVAAGRLDGFWEAQLKPWDVAAGVHLVRAVGGLVTTYAGAPHTLDAPTLVSAAPALHREMLAVLADTRAA